MAVSGMSPPQIPVEDFAEPPEPEYREGMVCFVREDGKREGWFVSSSNPGNGNRGRGGYEYYRVGNRSIAHHRLLAFGWGIIDSVFDETVDVDHAEIPCRWLNVEWNLDRLEKKEHGVITYQRNAARKDGQVQLNLELEPI